MDFQTASGQEVFRRGSGFGFELQPEVYRLPWPAPLVPRPFGLVRFDGPRGLIDLRERSDHGAPLS
jgi:hypothetical protein